MAALPAPNSATSTASTPTSTPPSTSATHHKATAASSRLPVDAPRAPLPRGAAGDRRRRLADRAASGSSVADIRYTLKTDGGALSTSSPRRTPWQAGRARAPGRRRGRRPVRVHIPRHGEHRDLRPELAWVNDGVFIAGGERRPAAFLRRLPCPAAAPNAGASTASRSWHARSQPGTHRETARSARDDGHGAHTPRRLLAGDQAGFELAMPDRRVGIGLASEDARGRHAGIGAVEAEADAALRSRTSSSASDASAQIVQNAAHPPDSSTHRASMAASMTSGRRLGRPAPSRADALRCSLWPPCTRFA